MADPNNMDYSIARAAGLSTDDYKPATVTSAPIDYHSVMAQPEPRAKIARVQDYPQRDYQGYSDQQADRPPVRPAALDRPWSQYDWQVYDKLTDATRGLVGHSINEYGSKVDPDVGCAVGVSLAVSKGYGYNVNEITVQGLERSLKAKGFTEVGSTKDIKPSDIILAYRGPNDYGHAALYMGNGQIFNNDSDSRLMAMESVSKYNSAEFKKFVILRRPAEVPSVPRGS